MSDDDGGAFPYTVTRRLGQGAFGEVVKVVDNETGEEHACKRIFLRRARDVLHKSSREPELLPLLRHPNVLHASRVLHHDGCVHLIMPLMAGDLGDVLERCRRPLPEAAIKLAALHLLRGLAYLHAEQGVMHRDIKPSNLLISTTAKRLPVSACASDGAASAGSDSGVAAGGSTEASDNADCTIVIGDFGLARRLMHTSTAAAGAAVAAAGDTASAAAAAGASSSAPATGTSAAAAAAAHPPATVEISCDAANDDNDDDDSTAGADDDDDDDDRFGHWRRMMRRRFDAGAASGDPGSEGSAGGASSQVPGHYTHQIASRWYRAPEILFGATQYDEAVDLWAAGCVIAELFELHPLAAGASDIEQIYCVLQVAGAPTPDEWPEFASLPDVGKLTFPRFPKLPLGLFVPSASPPALDLLGKLLQLNPARRISATEALAHPWFAAAPPPCGVELTQLVAGPA